MCMREDFKDINSEFSSLKMFLTVKVLDENKDVIYKHKQVSKSYLANFSRALMGVLYSYLGSRITFVVKTNGVSQDYPYLYGASYPVMQVSIGANALSGGIVFGSGTTPPSPEDYNLESTLGTSVLDYSSCNVSAPATSGNDNFFKISRSAQNISSTPLTISEVGVIAREYDNTPAWVSFMIIRDVLDVGITLDPLQAIFTEYTIIVST